jgi:cytochrome o ubiquinol oxidase subunit II
MAAHEDAVLTPTSYVNPIELARAVDSRAEPKGDGRWARPLVIAPFLLFEGCALTHAGFLNAAGPIAAGERHLLAEVGMVMLFVVGPVLVLTPLFAWHYRLTNAQDAFRPKWNFSWVLEFFIWIPPTLIVVGLSVALWIGTHRFDPYAPLGGTVMPLEVQAVGFDWKWLFIYPDSDVATVNELVVPVERPVHISLTSATVMQSLFVPQLAGQIYAMPGMTTQLNLSANRAGVFPGQNSQYNGAGFAQDRFSVRALTPAEYELWLTRTRASARPLTNQAVSALAVPSTESQALFFSTAPPDLFQHILEDTRSIPRGAATRP